MEFDQFVKLPVSPNFPSLELTSELLLPLSFLLLLTLSPPSHVLQGCTKSSHIAKSSLSPPALSAPTPSSAATSAPTTISSDGKETYGSAPPPSPASKPTAPTAIATAAPVVPKEIIEEQDEPGVEVPEGAKCKRRGCGLEVGKQDECAHHPGVVSASLNQGFCLSM